MQSYNHLWYFWEKEHLEKFLHNHLPSILIQCSQPLLYHPSNPKKNKEHKDNFSSIFTKKVKEESIGENKSKTAYVSLAQILILLL